MPRALIFLACDRVILGQDNGVSLIQIISEIRATLPPEVPDPIPANSATQMVWYVFAEWIIAPDEFGQPFEQRIALVNSQGQSVALETLSEFVPEVGKPKHRMIGNLTFFPLVPQGDYNLTLSVRRRGEQDWQASGSYPLQVIYQRIAQSQAIQ